jgi:serine/threonine-protein kinase RsbW
MGILPERLELDSRLTDLCRVWPWTEAWASAHGLAEQTRFALHLCMEEALANVVLHGYQNQPGHPVVIRCSMEGGWLVFAIEDEAPPFTPVDPDLARPADNADDLELMEPGGNGIRLLHRFAGSLKYERLPRGNRLTIGFPLSPPELTIHSTSLDSSENLVEREISWKE